MMDLEEKIVHKQMSMNANIGHALYTQNVQILWVVFNVLVERASRYCDL